MLCPSFRTGHQLPADWLLLLLWLIVPLGTVPATSRADIIVLANQTSEPVVFRIGTGPTTSDPITIPARDLTALMLRGVCELVYDDRGREGAYHLDANSAYLFVRDERGQLQVTAIDLGSTDATAGGRTLTAGARIKTAVDLPLEVFVDNYELTTRAAWEPRLRKRIERVSQILEQNCRIRLRIVQVGQWAASQEAVEFPQALAEFQRRVTPAPGHVALGFTGRYRQSPGLQHLGGTPGILHPHILVREWSATMSEPEREEVLLHEIGHYLGAVHSPDPASVMRPILADSQVLHKEFRIRFDPVNLLLINLVAEEIRERRATSVRELSAGTRLRLSQIYAKLAEAIPEDTSARQYQFQVGMVDDSPLASATRTVVSAVRTAALTRADTLRQDRLTEHYVRSAAAAVQGAPADVAPAAFLLGLGIALDDSETLLQNRLTREFCRTVETADERQERCQALGDPTVLDRRDLRQHFFLSGYLATVAGPAAAEAAGIAKELTDAKTGSGFSYVDLAADLAGIAFAERVLRREVPLAELAQRWDMARFMPDVTGLPEGLRWNEVVPQLAGTGADSFTSYRRTIRDRLALLRAAETSDGEPQ
ncbi:MAG: matrixin family metalloprotease [Planctomycetaceae bacterium]|nr:matrixin family metalloprotease [Planctomycetaceae bacterium]